MDTSVDRNLSLVYSSSDAQKTILQSSDLWCPIYYRNLECSRCKKTIHQFILLHALKNNPFSLRWHVRHRLLTSQVGIVQLALAPCLSSWPPQCLLYYFYSLPRLYRSSSLWYDSYSVAYQVAGTRYLHNTLPQVKHQHQHHHHELSTITSRSLSLVVEMMVGIYCTRCCCCVLLRHWKKKQPGTRYQRLWTILTTTTS